MRPTTHPVVSEFLREGLLLKRIAPSITVDLARTQGYLQHGSDWWCNPACSFSYKYFSLDPLYPKWYFDSSAHPSQEASADLYNYMQECFEKLFSRRFGSILELGTGGGEITKELAADGLDYTAVEGTAAGLETLIGRGIPTNRIVHSDLRKLKPLPRTFDIVMCTEVAEHLEPFFASKVAENCTLHSDVVWFSCADRNRPAHVHHPNEQDLEVWDNLFAFLGHTISVPLDGRHGRAGRLYIKDACFP